MRYSSRVEPSAPSRVSMAYRAKDDGCGSQAPPAPKPDDGPAVVHGSGIQEPFRPSRGAIVTEP